MYLQKYYSFRRYFAVKERSFPVFLSIVPVWCFLFGDSWPAAWSFCLVLLPGPAAWSSCLIQLPGQLPGPAAWSSCLVQLPGPAAWSSCLVQLPGPAAWSSCLVQLPGPAAWSGFVLSDSAWFVLVLSGYLACRILVVPFSKIQQRPAANSRLAG
jgi:hypothetical protein